MLAFVSKDECPTEMLAFFLLTVANASMESRKRLVRMITHPAAQALSLQLVLGQKEWSGTMFRSIRPIDIHHPGLTGDFATAYIGVAHCPDEGHYVYSGSGAGLKPSGNRYKLRGEASRMHGHERVLALGHDVKRTAVI